MADQLCTLAQVRARVGITDPADTDDDVLIGEYIDQVSDWITDLVGMRLVPDAGATYLFDTSAGSVLPIPKGIRAVTALGVASTHQPETGGTYTAVDAGDIVLRPAEAERRPGVPATQIVILGASPRLAWAINGAQVTGDFGFEATPPRVVAVALDAVAVAYANRKAGTSGAIGADDAAGFPWAQYFSKGSPQRATLERLRAVSSGLGIG